MAKDTTKLHLGHANVSYGGTTVGHTMGGVTVSITEESNDIMADDFGVMPVDSVYNGSTVEVTVPLGQIEMTSLETAFPFAVLADSKLKHGKIVGERASAHFAELVVQPTATAFVGVSLVVHNAVVSEVSDISFTNDEQTVTEVTFRGYLDSSSTDGLIAYQGSPT